MAATFRVRACLLVLVLLLTTISIACAADQTITLRLGVKTAFALERPFETVLIGDPNIVDVHALGERRVTLEPLKSGSDKPHFRRRAKYCDRQCENFGSWPGRYLN